MRVRSRQWLVEEVVRPERPDASALVTLACADDDAQGRSLQVFWDYELDRRILAEEGWSDLAERGFDAPRRFAAFLHTLRWHCVTATDANLFQAPFRAGIRIDAYQMEPLRKALRLPRVNLFIADDTGLGKTIEAGLIARELLLRRKAKTCRACSTTTAPPARSATPTRRPSSPRPTPTTSAAGWGPRRRKTRRRRRSRSSTASPAAPAARPSSAGSTPLPARTRCASSGDRRRARGPQLPATRTGSGARSRPPTWTPSASR